MHFNKIVRQAMDGHEVIVVKRTPRGSTEIPLARIIPYMEIPKVTDGQVYDFQKANPLAYCFASSSSSLSGWCIGLDGKVVGEGNSEPEAWADAIRRRSPASIAPHLRPSEPQSNRLRHP